MKRPAKRSRSEPMFSRMTAKLARALAEAKGGEAKMQMEIMAEARLRANPGVVIWHCFNGPALHHDLKWLGAMGVLAGVSDLHISMPENRMAFMELKTAKGRVAPVQRLFLIWMRANGHLTAVCRSKAEALAKLKFWGAIR